VIYTAATAAVIDLSPAGVSVGIGQLYLYFAAGTYDTSNTYTFGALTANAAPDSFVAIGMAPIEISVSSFTLTDSVFASVRNVVLVSSPVITLPANPWDGMEIAVRDATLSTFAFPIILTGNAQSAAKSARL
jgi:hypothetical protein